MEVGYLQRYKREYEIQKPISLAFLNGQALQNLRETGTCEFELPETLLRPRLPGAVLPAHQVGAAHHPVRHRAAHQRQRQADAARAAPSARTPRCPTREVSYQGVTTGPDDRASSRIPVGIQAIATSTGQNDAGLFELNFRDERYLPFEGAGAISQWRLESADGRRASSTTTRSPTSSCSSATPRARAADTCKTAAEFNVTAQLNNDPGRDLRTPATTGSRARVQLAARSSRTSSTSC